MKFKLYYVIGMIAFIFCLITAFVYPEKNTGNNPPEITITSPLNHDLFSWNSTIRYRIKVIDIEDGASDYDEINAREVLLEVCYLRDASKAKQYLAKKSKVVKEHNGLTMIRNSDCFTCHAAKNRLIGPSFDLIAKKYPLTKSSVERLTKTVLNGSAGVWGKVAMPAHKLIKAEEIKQMISWILIYNTNPDINFYPGIEGAFRIQGKPAKFNRKGVIVLTASYTDHGERSTLQNRKYRQHSILLSPANAQE
jgi:cytochrome c